MRDRQIVFVMFVYTRTIPTPLSGHRYNTTFALVKCVISVSREKNISADISHARDVTISDLSIQLIFFPVEIFLSENIFWFVFDRVEIILVNSLYTYTDTRIKDVIFSCLLVFYNHNVLPLRGSM